MTLILFSYGYKNSPKPKPGDGLWAKQPLLFKSEIEFRYRLKPMKSTTIAEMLEKTELIVSQGGSASFHFSAAGNSIYAFHELPLYC